MRRWFGIAVVVTLMIGHPGLAQVEFLDPTFGDEGVTIVNTGLSFWHSTGSALELDDGSLLLAGGFGNAYSTGSAGFICKTDADGQLDDLFGDSGCVVDYTHSALDHVFEVHGVQASGKIIVEFNTQGNPKQVLRLNANGERDDTFGLNGLLDLSVFEDEVFYEAVVLPSDKILLSSRRTDEAENSYLVTARFSSEGELDLTYGQSGLAEVGLGNDFGNPGGILEVYSDGRVLVGGTVFGTERQFVFARLFEHGELDETFGGDGIAFIAATNSDDIVQDLDFGRFGAIVATGYASSASDVFVTQLSEDGQLDTEFGTGGFSRHSFSNYRSYLSYIEVVDDKIVAGGSSWIQSGHSTPVAIRLLSNGALDPNYGIGGFSESFDGASASSYINPTNGDGLLAIGNTPATAINRYYISLVKLEDSGYLDRSFGTDGSVQIGGITNGRDEVTSLARQSDGKILVTGDRDLPGQIECTVTRFTSAGVLDESFGINGVSSFGPCTNRNWASIVVLADNRFVTAASFHTGPLIARYMSDGTLDPTFGNNGFVQTDTGEFFDIKKILRQPDGKLIIAGDLGNGYALFRLHQDGTPDFDFGNKGLVLTDVDVPFNALYDGDLLDDNRIVVGGRSSIGPFTIVAYLPDGSIDSSFGNEGFATVTFGENQALSLGSLTVTNDGSIVISGRYGTAFAFAKLLPDGSLDTAFGSGGKLLVEVSSENVLQTDLIEDSIGRVLAVGYVAFYDPGGRDDSQLAVVRLTSEGHLDDTFGANGTAILDFVDQVATPTDLVELPNGSIAIGATYGDGFYDDIMLAAFLPTATTDTEDAPGEFPTSATISGVFPNPTTDGSSVTITLAQNESLSVAIYDMLGRRLQTTFNGDIQAGTPTTISIDTADLPSGVYTLRFEGNQTMEARSFSVVR